MDTVYPDRHRARAPECCSHRHRLSEEPERSWSCLGGKGRARLETSEIQIRPVTRWVRGEAAGEGAGGAGSRRETRGEGEAGVPPRVLPACLQDGAITRDAVGRGRAAARSLSALLCGEQGSREASRLVLAEEKTRDAQTAEFPRIPLSADCANMLGSLSDAGNLVPRLETVPESHVIPSPPQACGLMRKPAPAFACLPARTSGGPPPPAPTPKDAGRSAEVSTPSPPELG